jgi:hypothetical protein
MEDISKNKNLICFGTNIQPGTTYTTNPEKVVFNTVLTISAQANTDFTIDIQFSHFQFDTDFRTHYTHHNLADEPFFRVIPVSGEYCRVKITNNDLATNCKIILFSYLSLAKQVSHTHQLTELINEKEHAGLVMIANDYKTGLIEDLFMSREVLRLGGYASNFTNQNKRTLYNHDSQYYNTSGGFLSISSTSINDVNTTGAGAHSILIIGLDAGYNTQVETILLNGIVAVSTTKQFIRVNSAEVITAGTLGYNSGDIYIRDLATTSMVDIIPAEFNTTKSLKYCVPAGQSVILKNVSISSAVEDHSQIRLYYKPYGELYRLLCAIDINAGDYTTTRPINLKLPEKTEIWATVKLNHNPGSRVNSFTACIDGEIVS